MVRFLIVEACKLFCHATLASQNVAQVLTIESWKSCYVMLGWFVHRKIKMPKEADYPCLELTTHFHKLHLNFHFFHLNYIIVSVNLNLPHLHYLEAS
jgi:hypothetical protein